MKTVVVSSVEEFVTGRHENAKLILSAPMPIGSALIVCLVAVAMPAFAQRPVEYHVSFPHPEQHWMQVDVTFPVLSASAIEIHISRSSPGRYALHDFSRNIYDVQAADSRGAMVSARRVASDAWQIRDHGGEVRFSYKVFGDTLDGTHLAIDRTHAHINIPAAFVWAVGLDARPVSVTFDLPAGLNWKVATQLHATREATTFTGANLQFLMDSPIEVSNFSLRAFTVDDPSGPGGKATFRVVVHHAGHEADVDAFVADIQKIVTEERKLFGEYPHYEPGYYTFLFDDLPWAFNDGMEHRNSAVITGALDLATSRNEAIATVAHEFFHQWNVERIRPKSIEPFQFDRSNPSGELWIPEGFTGYYETLSLWRAGFLDLRAALARLGRAAAAVSMSAGTRFQTLEDASFMAETHDGTPLPLERTNAGAGNFRAFYTWGGAIAVAMDLSLRDHSAGHASLDDFMRAMWRKYGKLDGPQEGLVGRPYTMEDVKETLAEVAGDVAFADDFFARFIQGHEIPDYRVLFANAGLVWGLQHADRAWAGDVLLENVSGGVRISGSMQMATPLYDAGVQQDDVIASLDGTAITSIEHLAAVVQGHRAGDRVLMTFVRRDGEKATGELILRADPRRELVTLEQIGQQPTAAQRAFRDAWLGQQ